MEQTMQYTEEQSLTADVILGDSRSELAKFADQTFQMCVTSPPYWGLRDYDIKEQIGAENTIDKYIDDLVAIFREVKRTLKDDGTPHVRFFCSYGYL